MILLRMFFVFEGWSSWRLWGLILVKLLYLWIPLVSFYPFFSFSLSLASLKCLRKASIYRSLGVGERHMAESNWWHMSQTDWSAYVIAYTCEAACVIAYTCWGVCVITYTCWGVCDWFLHDTWQISVGFWVVITKPSSNTWCFVIGCILWTW